MPRVTWSTTGSWSGGSVEPSTGTCGKRVGISERETARAPRATSPAYDPAEHPGDQAPGHEEQGGYVDVEDHRY
jgi:hypothetical protein